MAVAGCPDYFLHHPNYQVSAIFRCVCFFRKFKYVFRRSLNAALAGRRVFVEKIYHNLKLEVKQPRLMCDTSGEGNKRIVCA